jgi:non-specific serine/threonine protein kinase
MGHVERDAGTKRSLYEESLAIYRELDDPMVLGMLLNLGVWAYNQGNYQEARAFLEETITRRPDRRSVPPGPLIHLGMVNCREGRHAEAGGLVREALRKVRAAGNKRLIVECLEGLAEVAHARGRTVRALRLLGAADCLRDAIGFGTWPSGRVAHDRLLTDLRKALGEAAFDAAWKAGKALTWQQAADYACEEMD